MANDRSHPILVERLAAPAQRALAGSGYSTLEQLAEATEAEIAALHGIGPRALTALRQAMAEAGLSFREGAIRDSH